MIFIFSDNHFEVQFETLDIIKEIYCKENGSMYEAKFNGKVVAVKMVGKVADTEVDHLCRL